MKRMLKLAVVLTVAAMAMATVMVHGQTPTCAATYIANCNDTSTPSGFTQCCATISDLYQNDLTCLCSLFQLANFNASRAVAFLTGCGVNTGGTSPCSGGSPVPSFSPAPQPSVVRSPPPPPSSIPSPPKNITASPPPPSIFVPSPPSIFGSMRPPPPITPPSSPVNITLGGRNGAARSSLIGMARVVCTFLFGLIFVAI